MLFKYGIRDLRIYRDPQVIFILFLGFSSGLPFLLTLATLHVWLSEIHISKTAMGLFVLMTFPYALKFLWSPIMDRYAFPFLSALIGHRKGWLLGSQLGVVITLLCLGFSDPESNIELTALWAFGVSLFSATQDVAYEAFRIEGLTRAQGGAGAGASSFGYRLGMWVAGAGALYLASYMSWTLVYSFMACAMGIGITTTLLSEEPIHLKKDIQTGVFKTFVYASWKYLLKRSDLFIVFGFIFLYKIGDTILNTLTMPFLIEIGFSKLEIAHVAKAFGLFTMMIGGLVGGVLLTRQPINRVLLKGACMQVIASLLFMFQAIIGYDLGVLFLTVGFENFACGFGTSAFIVFLSSRCSQPYTGTHFALLTSFGSISRILISAAAGWAADHLSWVSFYGVTALLIMPCVLLVFLQNHKFYQDPHVPIAPSLA